MVVSWMSCEQLTVKGGAHARRGEEEKIVGKALGRGKATKRAPWVRESEPMF